jgi:hypothetical protein
MNSARVGLLLGLALVLSACADSRFVEHPILSLIGSDTQGGQPVAGSPVQAHCARLATQRAHDAEYSGEDEATQRSVYDKTYSDCLAWDKQHKG